MQEILFRGKKIDNGEWIYGDFIRASCQNFILERGETTKTKVVFGTIGQYIGLTDKNGQKIFDGDIVQDVYNKQVYAVEYHDCSFIRVDANGYHYTVCESDTFAIIGNIHDNPELIGEEALEYDKR